VLVTVKDRFERRNMKCDPLSPPGLFLESPKIEEHNW
jgi:hypothetical protein